MRAWSRSPSPQHRRFLQNLWEIEDGKRVNPTGTQVFVTKSGSMTKDRFPAFCHHFVQNLPEGQGKGGLPVILIFDGHASRWNFTGLNYYLRTTCTASAYLAILLSGRSLTMAGRTPRGRVL